MHRALIVDQHYEDYRQKIHTQKLDNIKHAVDTKSPPTFSHLDSRGKQNQTAQG